MAFANPWPESPIPCRRGGGRRGERWEREGGRKGGRRKRREEEGGRERGGESGNGSSTTCSIVGFDLCTECAHKGRTPPEHLTSRVPILYKYILFP